MAAPWYEAERRQMDADQKAEPQPGGGGGGGGGGGVGEGDVGRNVEMADLRKRPSEFSGFPASLVLMRRFHSSLRPSLALVFSVC